MRRVKIFFPVLFLLMLSTTTSLAREPDIISHLRDNFPEPTIISFDPTTNTIVIHATPEEQQKIGEMLKILDTLPPQIAIEARFIEFIVTETGELGGELRLLDLALGDVARDAAINIIVDWIGFPADPAAGIIRLLHDGNPLVDPTALIRALAKVGAVEVISAPRVVTLSGHPARIELSLEVPYFDEVVITGGMVEVPDMLLREIGIFLEVTPTAVGEGPLITMDIEPTVGIMVERLPVELGGVETGLFYPVIDERPIQTHAVIESGETIVLGGLIGREERITDRRMPLLGDIPVLGQLFFRHRYHFDEKRKLLIFLTAHLVDPWGDVAVARREN